MKASWEMLNQNRNIDAAFVAATCSAPRNIDLTKCVDKFETTKAAEIAKIGHAVVLLDNVERQRSLKMRRHDVMERRRAERAGLKEGLQLVEERRARHAANALKASRWTNPTAPIPAAAPISARNQVRRQAAIRSSAAERRVMAVAGVQYGGFEPERVRAAAEGASARANGLNARDVRALLKANGKATDGSVANCRARLLALLS